MSFEKRLTELGIVLPEVPKPAAIYVPAVTINDLVFLSGQACTINGRLQYEGKLGKDLTIAKGQEAARTCMINLLSALKQEIGSLDRVERIVNVKGYINSASGFVEQPYVMNGASQLLESIFGEAGKHSRCALAANELPFNTPVEIEMIVQIKMVN